MRPSPHALSHLSQIVLLPGIPLITQSDRGTENNVIANCHTLIRHQLDPSLIGTLQHRWCVEKANIKPESTWSQLRRQFTPGFENQLDFGYNNGLYNPDDPLEKLSNVSFNLFVYSFLLSDSFFDGSLSHGSKLSLMHGCTATTLVLVEPINTSFYLRVFLTLFT